MKALGKTDKQTNKKQEQIKHFRAGRVSDPKDNGFSVHWPD